MSAPLDEQPKSVDVLGVGFGPSNLALAVALLEAADAGGFRSPGMCFLEKQTKYAWHPGLLLPGTTMQVSFLKDLVTQRDPTSRYSFLNFMKVTGRLASFTNLREFHPLRIEFAEYLAWVAHELRDHAFYGAQVTGVEPIHSAGEGRVALLRVHVDGPRGARVFTCGSLVLAVGGRPRSFPGSASASERVIHSTEFLPKVERALPDRGKRYEIAVVGGGQSAVEMLLYLQREYPAAHLTLFLRGYALVQSDSSHFVNELFCDESVSQSYEGNEYVRKAMFERRTNYGVVDNKEIAELYSIMYSDRIHGRARIKIARFCELARVETDGNGVVAVIDDHGAKCQSRQRYDAVFSGAGCERQIDDPLLRDVGRYILRDAAGRPLIDRHYALQTQPGFAPRIYVQGASEAEHGIGATLLSNIATRAGEIAESILSHSAAVHEVSRLEHRTVAQG